MEGSGNAEVGRADGRAVVTLSRAVAKRVGEMGEALGGATNAEVVRRGLILLDLLLSLPEDEELVIRNRETEVLDRVRFAWDLISHDARR